MAGILMLCEPAMADLHELFGQEVVHHGLLAVELRDGCLVVGHHLLHDGLLELHGSELLIARVETVLEKLLDAAARTHEVEFGADSPIAQLLENGVLFLPVDQPLCVAELPEDERSQPPLAMTHSVDYIGESLKPVEQDLFVWNRLPLLHVLLQDRLQILSPLHRPN